MKITLNIGTISFNKRFTLTTSQIVEACRHAEINLTLVECKQSNTETTVCAEAEYTGADDITATIYNLSQVLSQGCIAWIDGGGVGHLTGPCAADWGAFNLDYFLFPSEPKKPFDVAGFCIGFECGDLTTEEIVDGFQELISSGIAWQLQGIYGRTAKQLIASGRCSQ